MLEEAGLKVHGPTLLRSDNQSAITWAVGEKSPSGRAKHIAVRMHFVRDCIKNGTLVVGYVPTEENDADVLTKPLGRIALSRVNDSIGLGSTTEEEC